MKPVCNRFGLIGILLLIGVAGCQSSEAPEDLHDHDHFVHPHWPSSVADIATKIDERLTALKQAPDAARVQQLADILGWAPEITADSPLEEAQWVPIFEQGTSLSDQVRRSGDQLAPAVLQQVEGFRDLIRERASLLETESAIEDSASSDSAPVLRDESAP